MSAKPHVLVPKLWPNSTVVCVATGPSLTQAQVDFCRDKAHVIAINNAYTLAPWADVLWACDAKWWRWHKGVPSFTGLKYSLYPSFPDVQVLRNLGGTGLSLDPSGVKTGHNGGFQVINLAVLLGATRVCLLGYDMKDGPKKQKHFHPDHPDKTGPPFAVCLRDFQTLVAPLAAAGVSIVNCTPGSALKCFPMGRLEDVLVERAA